MIFVVRMIQYKEVKHADTELKIEVMDMAGAMKELDKLTLKRTWKRKGSISAKTILKKKKKMQDHAQQITKILRIYSTVVQFDIGIGEGKYPIETPETCLPYVFKLVILQRLHCTSTVNEGLFNKW